MSGEHAREAAMHEHLAAERLAAQQPWKVEETGEIVSVDHRLRLAQLHAILHLAEKVEELTAAVQGHPTDIPWVAR